MKPAISSMDYIKVTFLDTTVSYGKGDKTVEWNQLKQAPWH